MAQEAKTVSALKELNFSQLTLQEKVAIKQAGRPLPDIKIEQEGVSHSKKYIRSFNCDWYQRKTWLCGCEVKNALFCFPCLLFGGDSVWSKDGFACIKNLKEKTEKHENSRKHIDNVISLSVLGSVNIKERLSEAYRLSVNAHNKKVTKNREILSKIIDCIKFCGHFELPLRGHDETDDSANPGVFRGLINHASQLDPDLRAHLESNAVFKGVSKTIQNELLDCLLQIYRDQIRKEIKEAPFVAVMADDTTDVSEHTQMVIVLRYLLGEEVVERFWGFFTPENQTADGLSKCILDQLNTVLEGNAEKLIAQTFDGASVMKGKKGGVQAKIRLVYNNAHFIHCYAHQLNLIMQNAASVTRGSRIFFANLSGIAAFFSRSPLRLDVLTKHMTSRIPRPSSTRWNFHSRTVNKVYEHFEPLKKCMEEIQSTSNATITIREATGILKTLNDESFKFWLELFHQIMPHVAVIFQQMQCRDIDVTKAHEFITNFKRAISEIRNSKYCENPTKTLMAEAKEVCDCVCADIAERFSFTKQLVAAKLFNKDCFTNFKQKVTLEEVEVATEAYPMIAKERLLTELRAFYNRSDLHEFSKLSELLKIVNENNLGDVLCEFTKLIKILLTIPMTTAEPERCFSTLKRVKTFLRSTMMQERLNALAMISIEKLSINNMPGLNEKVIDLFAQNKNRRMDFLFK